MKVYFSLPKFFLVGLFFFFCGGSAFGSSVVDFVSRDIVGPISKISAAASQISEKAILPETDDEFFQVLRLSNSEKSDFGEKFYTRGLMSYKKKKIEEALGWFTVSAYTNGSEKAVNILIALYNNKDLGLKESPSNRLKAIQLLGISKAAKGEVDSAGKNFYEAGCGYKDLGELEKARFMYKWGKILGHNRSGEEYEKLTKQIFLSGNKQVEATGFPCLEKFAIRAGGTISTCGLAATEVPAGVVDGMKLGKKVGVAFSEGLLRKRRHRSNVAASSSEVSYYCQIPIPLSDDEKKLQ